MDDDERMWTIIDKAKSCYRAYRDLLKTSLHDVNFNVQLSPEFSIKLSLFINISNSDDILVKSGKSWTSANQKSSAKNFLNNHSSPKHWSPLVSKTTIS